MSESTTHRTMGEPPPAVLVVRGLQHDLVTVRRGPAGGGRLKQVWRAMAGRVTGDRRGGEAGGRSLGDGDATASADADSADQERYSVHIDQLTLPRGGFVSILGPSGCGKTTLLTILGLARQPYRQAAGEPAVQAFRMMEYDRRGRKSASHDLAKLWNQQPSGQRAIQDLRRRLLGFALQSGELLTNLTVLENVAMPLRLNGIDGQQVEQRAKAVLESLSLRPSGGDADDKPAAGSLWDRRHHLPSQLSGGEYQRVAIARALAHRPQVLFLDEPTGALDPNTAGQALTMLAQLQAREGVTVVMITHDQALAQAYTGYMIRMTSPRPGLGTIASFLRRDAEGVWRETDAAWRLGAQTPTEQAPAAEWPATQPPPIAAPAATSQPNATSTSEKAQRSARKLKTKEKSAQKRGKRSKRKKRR